METAILILTIVVNACVLVIALCTIAAVTCEYATDYFERQICCLRDRTDHEYLRDMYNDLVHNEVLNKIRIEMLNEMEEKENG